MGKVSGSGEGSSHERCSGTGSNQGGCRDVSDGDVEGKALGAGRGEEEIAAWVSLPAVLGSVKHTIFWGLAPGVWGWAVNRCT
jgi:hypothetical protein